MNQTRHRHTATLLPNGKVLVAGGSNPYTLSSAELYNPATGTWTYTGFLNEARTWHIAELLPNGKVLVAGGAKVGSLSSAELYDPASGTWAFTSSMNETRPFHQSALLGDGRVLVTGGWTGGDTGEIYDPASGTWTYTGSMPHGRMYHTLTTLANGEPLVAGGVTTGYSHLSASELYGAAAGIWATTGSMTTTRAGHKAVRLCDGGVLVMGGHETSNASSLLSSAEIYHPGNEIWQVTGSMNDARRHHTATLLSDGGVLIAGGSDNSGTVSSAELYDSGGCVTVSNWTFLDVGFIAGGQDGAQRVYSDPAAVAASPWSFQSPCGLSLRMSFEDDANCNTVYNPYTQTGLAVTTVQTCEPMRMHITWSGLGEREEPEFELMSLYVNPSNLIEAFDAPPSSNDPPTLAKYGDYDFHGSAHAPGGGYRCNPDPATGLIVAPVVSSPAPPQYVDLPAGSHAILIQTTTNDEFYHIGAHYQFQLSFEPIAHTISERISSGAFHTLAAKLDGTAWAWGWNGYGGLGDGTTVQRTTPVQVSGLSDVIAVAGGRFHSLALKDDGTVWAWGYNAYGQVGDGTTINRTVPVQVGGLNGVTAIAAGNFANYALLDDGSVFAWGENTYGQLGDGTTTTRHSPVPVSGLTNITSIAGGGRHGIAARNDGAVWAWGANTYGQLGDGTTTMSSTPVQTSGVSETTAVSAGFFFSLALQDDGTVWGWGSNNLGQLGNGSTAQSVILPVQAVGLDEVVRIDAGYYHGLATRSDGTGWAWGANGNGQHGDGTTVGKSTPGTVHNLSNGLTLKGGFSHTAALESILSVFTCGRNSEGQLGDGTTTNKSLPVDIGFGL